LGAGNPVERGAQSLAHLVAQAKFSRDDFDVVRSV
jgi:hypothetical protein